LRPARARRRRRRPDARTGRDRRGPRRRRRRGRSEPPAQAQAPPPRRAPSPRRAHPRVTGRITHDLIASLVDAGSREHYLDAALYDYEYRRRRADVAFYRELAVRRLGERGRILELGAGSGRVTIPLARAGYEVVAVDASKPMLARLRERVARLPTRIANRIT